MKVLFIGGTGLISEAVSKLSVEKGIDLYLFNRGNHSESIPQGAKVITGDIRDAESAKQLLQNYSFDVVVNWVAFTPEQIQTDIKIFQGKTKQYIFISSTAVYDNLPTITESSTPYAPNPFREYASQKIACEKLLLEAYHHSNFPTTIVRPSFTYGNRMVPAAMNSWQHPWSLVDRIRKGKPIIVQGDGTATFTMTHNSDLAKGFIGLLGHPEAIGNAFHITSDEILTWNQIYQFIGQAANVTPKLLHIPFDFIAAHTPKEAGLLGDFSKNGAVYDNSKIKLFVPDYDATLPFATGIKQTMDWFEANPLMCTIDKEWDFQMDRIITAFETL